MKKHLIILILFLIILLPIFIKARKNVITNMPFYHDILKKRYTNYQNKYPNLTNKEVIKKVNMNLDYSFYTNTITSKRLNETTILVNKYYYLNNNYIPNNLEKLSTSFAKDKMYLVNIAKKSFELMAKEMLNNNLKIRAISTYRSFDYQSYLYNNYVKKDGVNLADTYSARPGYSEHQTGLAVDIDNIINNYDNFAETKEYNWLIDNAHRYGFILRYPKNKQHLTGYNYEAWHYRYVGNDIAEYIYKNKITYDEYYAIFLAKPDDFY